MSPLSSLTYAFRSLVKSPGHTLIALLTLALGIGVNTSMFSVVNALLFRTAPYPDPESLVVLHAQNRSGEIRNFSDQEIREIRPAATGFSALVTAGYLLQALAEPGQPAERLTGVGFSREMMDVFRVAPALGRPFAAHEFEPGNNQVILISDALWKARFGANRDIVGQTLRLDGETVTIIGVMPPSFEYPLFWGPASFWRPLNMTADQMNFRAYRSFTLIGRLKPGQTSQMITSQLASVAAEQEKNFPQDYPGQRYEVAHLHVIAMDEVGRVVSWMLLGLSGFVLLIACANLANLQLARATAYAREFAIRAALGASRLRLVSQQLYECVLLSVAGGVLGLLVALWVNGALESSMLVAGMPLFRVPMNVEILLLTLGISILTGLLFGIVPALAASRADVNTALKSQTRGSTTGRGHHRMRQLLIIGEVAMALVLLGGAAIMNKGFANMLKKPVGWDTSRILTAEVPIPEVRFDTGEKRIEFYKKLEARLAALPGVEHVALSTSLPLFSYTSERRVFVDAPAQGTAPDPDAAHVMITPSYFSTLGIPILEGNTFSPDVKPGFPQHILVNAALAQRFWPGESAVGKRLGVVETTTGPGEIVWREIIGVVGDVESAANISHPRTRLTVYRPLVQEPWAFVRIAIRSQNPASLIEPVRRAVSEVDPDMPADQIGTVQQFVSRAQHNLVMVGRLLLGFALLGMVLASVGVYGVVSNLVAQRTPEFGIRLALGARPSDVLGDVIRRGATMAGTGLIIGTIGTIGLGRFMSSAMPRLATVEPGVILLVSALLLAVTLVACWIPARRATRVDPLEALRAE